jgi:hypothetical protein
MGGFVVYRNDEIFIYFTRFRPRNHSVASVFSEKEFQRRRSSFGNWIEEGEDGRKFRRGLMLPM